jgi:hypothetical protein
MKQDLEEAAEKYADNYLLTFNIFDGKSFNVEAKRIFLAGVAFAQEELGQAEHREVAFKLECQRLREALEFIAKIPNRADVGDDVYDKMIMRQKATEALQAPKDWNDKLLSAGLHETFCIVRDQSQEIVGTCNCRLRNPKL